MGYSVSPDPFSSAGDAFTNAQGQASITATAGRTPGLAPLTVSIASLPYLLVTSFNLSVLPGPPQITLNSFFNGAGGQPGVLSATPRSSRFSRS